MSFDKRIMLAAAVMAVASTAQAVPSPSAINPEPVPAHVTGDLSAPKGPFQAPVAAPVGASSSLSSGSVLSPASVVSVAPTAISESHLLLGQINDAAREKVLQTIRSQVDGNLSVASANGPQVPAPMLNQMPPTIAAPAMPPTIRAMVPGAAVPVMPSDNVSLVATMVGSGSRDTRVMYTYNGGVYSAALGQKMLNGVTAKRVNGLSVTVTDGKRTWDVPVSASH